MQLARLVRIFNLSFASGIIPDCWKCATVIKGVIPRLYITSDQCLFYEFKVNK